MDNEHIMRRENSEATGKVIEITYERRSKKG